MTGPHGSAPRDVRLERMRYQVSQRVSRELAASLRLDEQQDMISGHLVQRLVVDVLAEKLPPHKLDDRQAFTVPRFATWRDHLYATYRGRWWARWMPAPRFVDEPHAHVLAVTIRDRWTYPSATTVAPGGLFGHVVLKSSADPLGGVRPWSI